MGRKKKLLIESDNNSKSDKIDKIDKIKKNVDILKKINSNVKTISNQQQNLISNQNSIANSMIDSLKNNQVLLWGLNQIDTILLDIYEQNINLKPSNKSNEHIQNNTIKNVFAKSSDNIYDPTHTYTTADLEFLNNEYTRIDIQISKMTTVDSEFDNLMDMQDLLAELIEKLETEFNNSNQNSDLISNITSDSTDSNNSTNFEKKSKSKKISKSKKTVKLKPYYNIGEIPEGYREATQEEAILNKKIGLFGKKKASRELTNLFDICGTIYIENTNLKELNLIILKLKGKLNYYKKEQEYLKISISSDKISYEQKEEKKIKLKELEVYARKTLDIFNLYVKNYEKISKQIILT